MYNKVLIIGETFHKQSGGGITLSNLFNNWPPEKLAVVTTPRSILKSDFNKCGNYYRLGKDEDDSCLFFKIIILCLSLACRSALSKKAIYFV